MDMEGKKFKEKRAALFSSARQDWATPQEFFDTLNAEFNFDLDACANSENHKTPEYFDEQKNGLIQDWGGIACFAIRRMDQKQRENGSRSVHRKEKSLVQRLLCLYQHEQIPEHFTNTYIIKQKSDLSKGV